MLTEDRLTTIHVEHCESSVLLLHVLFVLCGEKKDSGLGTPAICVVSLKMFSVTRFLPDFVVPELYFPILLWNLIKAIEYNRSLLAEMHY